MMNKTEGMTSIISLPNKTLYDGEINYYALNLLRIPNFRGCKMKDELSMQKPIDVECGVVNLNNHTQKGSHWCSYYKTPTSRYYFDSYGEPPPVEVLKYLKSPEEYNLPVIQRSAVIVQKDNSNECGALCLFVLKNLADNVPFPTILQYLQERYNSNTETSLNINV